MNSNVSVANDIGRFNSIFIFVIFVLKNKLIMPEKFKPFCIICSGCDGHLISVVHGKQKLLNASKRRDDAKHTIIEKENNVHVHEYCRKEYTKENYILAAIKRNRDGIDFNIPRRNTLLSLKFVNDYR